MEDPHDPQVQAEHRKQRENKEALIATVATGVGCLAYVLLPVTLAIIFATFVVLLSVLRGCN